MVLQSLAIYAGDDKTYVCYVKDRCLNPIDISNATCYFTVKVRKDDTAPTIQKSTAVSGEGEIGAANKGEMYFYLVPADTSGLEIRQYVFDIKVVLSSGKVYTVAEGILNLNEPVSL